VKRRRVMKNETKGIRIKNKINKTTKGKVSIISQLGFLFWPEDVGSR
jgi:hypothetical protein